MTAAPTPDDGTPAVLSLEEAIEFWDRRHQVSGELRSGGDLSFDHETNAILYALRLGRLIDIIGDLSSGAAPLRLLDAGCGKGYYARAMAGFGHRVDGIDSSAHAVEECRSAASADPADRQRFEVSTLEGWAPAYLYDVVYSVDVLFHVMDDAIWERSVRALAALVRVGGLLVLADHESDKDRVWGNYQKSRAVGRYRGLALECGLRIDPFVPYRFRDSPVGFHVFTRVA